MLSTILTIVMSICFLFISFQLGKWYCSVVEKRKLQEQENKERLLTHRFLHNAEKHLETMIKKADQAVIGEK